MFNKIELYIDYLINLNLFKGLSAFEIEEFLNTQEFDIVEYECGDIVSIDLKNTLFIASGSVATYDNRINGNKGLINIFEPGGGSNIIAVGEGKPYLYDNLVAIAKKRSVVLILETNRLLNINPEIVSIQSKVLSNIVAELFSVAENVVERTYINTETYASARLKSYLSLLSKNQNTKKVKIPLTRNELANYLNMDVSTLTKEINKYSQNGYIFVKGKNVHIMNDDFIE